MRINLEKRVFFLTASEELEITLKISLLCYSHFDIFSPLTVHCSIFIIIFGSYQFCLIFCWWYPNRRWWLMPSLAYAFYFSTVCRPWVFLVAVTEFLFFSFFFAIRKKTYFLLLLKAQFMTETHCLSPFLLIITVN